MDKVVAAIVKAVLGFIAMWLQAKNAEKKIVLYLQPALFYIHTCI